MKRLLITTLIPLSTISMDKVRSLALKPSRKKTEASIKGTTPKTSIHPRHTVSQPHLPKLQTLADEGPSRSKNEGEVRELKYQIANLSERLNQSNNENHLLRAEFDCFKKGTYFMVCLLLSMNILALIEVSTQ